MEQAFNELNEQLFVGPVWPASVLLGLMVVYAIVAMFGLADLGLDADVDIDADMSVDVGTPDLEVGGDLDVGGGDPEIAEVSGAGLLGSIGAMTVKWTNFGRIPIAIWGGIFTLAFWGFSYGLWHNYDSARYSPVWIPSILLAIRNTVLGVMVTKVITQPLVGKFDPVPGYDARRIVGCTCEIWSLEATPTSGQAKFRADAAPLLLNVRTDGGTIAKGTEARIVNYNPEKRIYTVTQIEAEK